MTNEDILYLRQDTQITPLVFRWYAWSHIISPVTAALNITHRHLKIMESFIECPESHELALENPNMVGGPFMNIPADKVSEVQELVEDTKKLCYPLMEISSAIKKLNDLLANSAKGASLEPLYEKIPGPLKGMIELVYDIYNNPSFRIFERLFYLKYDTKNHQEIVFSKITSDIRPFVLSTPILSSDGLSIKISFQDKIIDKIISSRINGIDFKKLSDSLKLNDNKSSTFRRYFSATPTPLPTDREYKKANTRIRYFGHACILLQSSGKSILIDPVISYQYPAELGRYTLADLPDVIDAICITHNHQDHIQLETLLQLRHKTKYILVPKSNVGEISDPSLKILLENLGFNNVVELEGIEEFNEIQNINIVAIPFLGEHGDLAISAKAAYLVRLNSEQFLFAVDSNNIDNHLYENIKSVYGPINNLFIGMECEGAPLSWLYEPLMQINLPRQDDHSRRLSGSNCEKAWKMLQTLEAKSAYVYAMGLEPWLSHIMGLNVNESSPQIIESNKFIRLCSENGVSAERLYQKKQWFI